MSKKTKRVLFTTFYWVWSLTWGCLMTWVGLIVAFFLIITGHKPHRFGHTFYFAIGQGWGGLELGAIFLVSKDSCRNDMFYHESGHGIQQLIFGNLELFIVGIPSVCRYWYCVIEEKKGKRFTNEWYDSVWFEGTATRWGEKVYKKIWED